MTTKPSQSADWLTQGHWAALSHAQALGWIPVRLTWPLPYLSVLSLRRLGYDKHWK